MPDFRTLWDKVPKISADGPHRVQMTGFFEQRTDIVMAVMASLPPVSKLTYRFDESQLSGGTLLFQLLANIQDPVLLPSLKYSAVFGSLVSLKTSTLNLGDHIQVLASLNLLERVSSPPVHYIDWDNEIASCPSLNDVNGCHPIVMNGWFKTNGAEWPPGAVLEPVFIGFHIRLFQCPELLSPQALDYYRAHGPIGCRDQDTFDSLTAHGVEAYISNCLTFFS